MRPSSPASKMPAARPSVRSGPWFSRFARWTAATTGRPSAFLVAALVIVAWAVTGPIFGYSDTWQLVINTGTTIVTFLMVFLIQHTQNRDSQALHVKLDELIRAVSGAKNGLIDLDDLTDEELTRVQRHYTNLARKSKHELRELQEDIATVESAVKK
ncbi:MAG: low affinity iron permease family protein [Opitutaceae bacterium]